MKDLVQPAILKGFNNIWLSQMFEKWNMVNQNYTAMSILSNFTEKD